MSAAGQRQVWEQFWKQGGSGAQGGCLPNANPAIDAVQRQAWQDFARRLPARAKVLDLGTGDGVVLERMRAKRPDLRLTGVDSSTVLPPARAGMILKAGVAMERLPFGDASFDAVTSQFGLEYSETAASCAELARVLRPDGRCRLLIHHSGGRVLAHNLARREALAWAARDSGAIEKARNLTRARAVAAIPTSPAFAEAVAQARSRFPDQPVAEEFTRAVKETLDRGRGDVKGALAVLDELEARATNEIGRIDSLAAAARDRESIEQIAAALEAAGVATEPASALHEDGGGTAFAWLIDGTRK